MNQQTIEPSLAQPTLLSSSPLFPRLEALNLARKTRRPDQLRAFRLDGVDHLFRQPLTFTPFAAAKPCSARCVFCSETLIPIGTRGLAAGRRPSPHYFQGLGRALKALVGLPLGLSLSGLEATDDATWLLRLLDQLDDFAASGGIVRERVLYSNGAGLCRETTGALLLPRLTRFGLDRVELSRHSFNPADNARIMRFRPGPIADQAVFERTVVDCLKSVPVRLVCLIQRQGVDTVAKVMAYLDWAEQLGVTDVVFREYSRLGDLYEPNRTKRHIEANRVILEDLLGTLLDEDHLFEPVSLESGYYFWNLRMSWRGRIRVTFETSDYRIMKARHDSAVVHKLVYHTNGSLCGDWDPNQQVLLRTGC